MNNYFFLHQHNFFSCTRRLTFKLNNNLVVQTQRQESVSQSLICFIAPRSFYILSLLCEGKARHGIAVLSFCLRKLSSRRSVQKKHLTCNLSRTGQEILRNFFIHSSRVHIFHFRKYFYQSSEKGDIAAAQSSPQGCAASLPLQVSQISLG